MNEFLKLLLPWPARDFNPITDTFVYGIFLSFIICLGIFLWKTILRSRLINKLVNQVSQHPKPAKPEILPHLETEFNGNKELAEVWHEFRNSLITREPKENQEKIVYKTDEASLFFSEERLLDQHLNLRFWNSVPALLVGAGILGTFVGLVWGLIPFAGINFGQTTEITEAIKKLLSGVSTAFITSVWGMLTSLLFNVLEKWRINKVNKAIVRLQHTLDQLFTLTTQEEIAFRQEDELAQQTQALKAFSTDLADKIGIAMDNIMSQSRVQNTQDSQKIISELQNVPAAISNAVAEKLAPNLNNLNTTVGELQKQSEKLDALYQNLIEASVQNTRDSQEIIRELQNAPGAIGSAVGNQLTPTLSNLDTAVEDMRKQSEKLDALYQSQIESRAQDVQNSREIIQELHNAPNAISNAMEPNLNHLKTAFESLNTTVAEAKSDIQNEIERGRQETRREFQNVCDVLSSVMTEKLIPNLNNLSTIVSDIQSATEHGRQEVVQELHKLSLSIAQIGIFAEAIDKASQSTINLPEHVAQIAEGIQELLKSVSSQTSEQFHQRLAEMDAFFSRAAQTLQDIQQGTGTLLQLQSEQIEVINDQLTNSRATLARGRDMLREMNASITNHHQITKTMQTVSQKLTEGSEKIERAGQQLNQAGVMFNEGNQSSLIVIREAAHQIRDTLSESYPLLNDFIRGFRITSDRLDRSFQGFQTIEDGLNGIFAEIEQGLNTYADATRESLSKYLTDFSEQLSQASVALARNVEILRDSVEGLTDMNESQLTVLAGSVATLKESIGKLDDINKHPTDQVRGK